MLSGRACAHRLVSKGEDRRELADLTQLIPVLCAQGSLNPFLSKVSRFRRARLVPWARRNGASRFGEVDSDSIFTGLLLPASLLVCDSASIAIIHRPVLGGNAATGAGRNRRQRYLADCQLPRYLLYLRPTETGDLCKSRQMGGR